MNKLIRDGKVGVLVSPGFGAGWSSWNSENKEFYCMDKGLVKLKLQDATAEDVKRYIESKGMECGYLGGWSDTQVVWVEEGKKFNIYEYDGHESLKFVENLSLNA